jgi:putative two-component system response regulator
VRISEILGRFVLAGADDATPRLAGLLRQNHWSFTRRGSPHEVLRHLRDDGGVDVVVIAPGPAAGAWQELCRTIKFDQRTGHIRVIGVLDHRVGGSYGDWFAAGADDCFYADADDQEISVRLHRALEAKRAADSLDDASAVLAALANAVEGKDHYTCGHVERVSAYCSAIGRGVGVDAEGLAALYVGGVVHDLGKIGIPDHILNKPGKLTADEMNIIKRHPLIGYDILKPLRTFRNVLPIVRWHHERPNGTGYPDGLKGDGLPLLPRIAAVADCFDALMTDRPYRAALPMAQCRQVLDESVRRGNLDGELVAALYKLLDQGTVGEIGRPPGQTAA